MKPNQRSFEIGIDRWQRPYVAVSADGSRKTSKVLIGQTQIRLGQPAHVSAVYDAKGRLELYLQGQRVARLPEKEVPKQLLAPRTITFGKRTGCKGRCSVHASWGGATVRTRAITEQDIAQSIRQQSTFKPMSPGFAPVEALTKGPKYHWFGYYDKFQWDSTMRYVLSLQVDFEGRSPRADDVAYVGMIDTKADNKWIELGTTKAFNWQQGAMLQWRPKHDDEVLWNDRESGRFVTRIYNIKTGKMRTLDRPTYHVAPDGKTALGLDFARINDLRPGYGYAGLPDPYKAVSAPKTSSIYRLDLDTGASKDILTLEQVAQFASKNYDPKRTSKARHYFNHLQINTDGSRFLLFHRWRPGKRGFYTRVLTAGMDGTSLRQFTRDQGLSHYAWKDPQHMLIWAPRRAAYVLYKDKPIEGYIRPVLRLNNGHQSYVPNTNQRWMVLDTYPDKDRMQMPFLYDAKTDEIFILGRFHSPKAYKGEWRVDNHPRISRDGKYVIIDSPHKQGRQLYKLDLSRYPLHK